MAKKKSTKTNAAYVLLDRTGSMDSLWDEAIGAVNTYIEKLEDDVKVYLACFDSDSFDVLREDKKQKVKKLTKDEVLPRSMTPLYDSAAKVMNKMLADKPDRAVFVVMTDGYENASHEYTLDNVRSLMSKLEKKDWPIVFLGANFKEANAYAVGTFKLNTNTAFTSTASNLNKAMFLNAIKTSAYFGTGDTRSMDWSVAEKESVEND